MATRWKNSYKAALRESDPAKFPALCDQARREIQDRILELATSSRLPTAEKDALEESLRQLFIRERRLPSA